MSYMIGECYIEELAAKIKCLFFGGGGGIVLFSVCLFV